jgi:hypothetical protein
MNLDDRTLAMVLWSELRLQPCGCGLTCRLQLLSVIESLGNELSSRVVDRVEIGTTLWVSNVFCCYYH